MTGWLLVVLLYTVSDNSVSKASHVLPSKEICEALALSVRKVKPEVVTMCLPNKAL